MAGENGLTPKRPSSRMMERLERPSTSQGFNKEEKEIMAECLKNESLQDKIWRYDSPILSQERRFLAAEMNREKALKIKALRLEMKLKQREEKQEESKKQKEQVAFEASMRTYEKQRKIQKKEKKITGRKYKKLTTI